MRLVHPFFVLILSMCLLASGSVVLASCGGSDDATTTLSTATINLPAGTLGTTTSTAVVTEQMATTQSSSQATAERQVEVPQLLGLDLSEAESLLDDCGLECEIEPRLTEDPSLVGLVIGQSPPMGHWAPVHSLVKVFPGIYGVPVPDLVGMTEEEASDALFLIELNPDITYVITLLPSKMGKVIEQDPEPGVLAELWTWVELKVGETTPPASGSVN